MSRVPPKGLTPKLRVKHDKLLDAAWAKTMRECPPTSHPPKPVNETRLLQCVGLSRSLGYELLPHQMCIIASATEIAEPNNVGGELRFPEIFLYFGRQSGKSSSLIVLVLDRLLLRQRSRIIWGAQQLSSANEQVEQDCWPRLIDKGFVESRDITYKKTAADNRIDCGATGSALKLRSTKASKGVRGSYNDLVVMDEIFSIKDFSSEEIMIPTLSTTRDRGSILLLASTSPDDESVFLRKRLEIHETEANREVYEKEDSRKAFWAWEAPEDANHLDPKVWRAFIPGLAFGLIPESFIADQAKTMRVDSFKREYLSMRIPSSEEASFVPTNVWKRIEAPPSNKLVPTGEIWLGIDASPDWTMCSIVACDTSGVIELVDQQSGVDWVCGFVRDGWAKKLFSGVALLARGPLKGEVEELKTIARPYPYRTPEGKEVEPLQLISQEEFSVAAQAFLSDVCKEEVHVVDSKGVFEDAVRQSRRRRYEHTGSFTIARRNFDSEASALVAACLAWFASSRKGWEKQRSEVSSEGFTNSLKAWAKGLDTEDDDSDFL